MMDHVASVISAQVFSLIGYVNEGISVKSQIYQDLHYDFVALHRMYSGQLNQLLKFLSYCLARLTWESEPVAWHAGPRLAMVLCTREQSITLLQVPNDHKTEQQWPDNEEISALTNEPGEWKLPVLCVMDKTHHNQSERWCRMQNPLPSKNPVQCKYGTFACTMCV